MKINNDEIYVYLMKHRTDRWLFRYFTWLFYSNSGGNPGIDNLCPITNIYMTAGIIGSYCRHDRLQFNKVVNDAYLRFGNLSNEKIKLFNSRKYKDEI